MKQKKSVLPSGDLFEEISGYWSEIADANSTEQQAEFVRNRLRPSGWILDLACGNGRHAVTISKPGYKVVGLDISPHLIEIAKQKAKFAQVSLPLVLADMRAFPFRSNVFSTVLSLDSSFGYLPSEKDDIKSLSEVTRTMTAQGVFIIDLFNRERMIQRYGKSFSFRLWSFLFSLSESFGRGLAGLSFKRREYPSFYLLQKRGTSPKEDMLLDLWIFHNKKTRKSVFFRHVVRLYDFHLLRMLLMKAGLKVAEIFGDYDAREYGEGTRRLILISSKI